MNVCICRWFINQSHSILTMNKTDYWNNMHFHISRMDSIMLWQQRIPQSLCFHTMKIVFPTHINISVISCSFPWWRFPRNWWTGPPMIAAAMEDRKWRIFRGLLTWYVLGHNQSQHQKCREIIDFAVTSTERQADIGEDYWQQHVSCTICKASHMFESETEFFILCTYIIPIAHWLIYTTFWYYRFIISLNIWHFGLKVQKGCFRFLSLVKVFLFVFMSVFLIFSATVFSITAMHLGKCRG